VEVTVSGIAGLDNVLADGAFGLPEAEEFSGLTRTHLYDLMGTGELPFTKVGKRRLIPKRALVDLLQRRLVPGQTGVK
jgi:excisionase family DNA binding protein